MRIFSRRAIRTEIQLTEPGIFAAAENHDEEMEFFLNSSGVI